MKLFDKVEPIYFIDDEMNKLLNDIDNKLSIHSSLSIEASS